MNKFTFKLKDRMKLTVEKVSPRVCLITVSGKHTHSYKVTSKGARDIVNGLKLTCSEPTFISKFQIGEEAYFSVRGVDEDFNLKVTEGKKVILNTTFNKKFLKKMYRTMREVFEIEQRK